MKQLLIGIILVFISIWGGAYVRHIIDVDSWMMFPTFFTTGALFIIGCLLVVHGLAEKDIM